MIYNHTVQIDIWFDFVTARAINGNYYMFQNKADTQLMYHLRSRHLNIQIPHVLGVF